MKASIKLSLSISKDLYTFARILKYNVKIHLNKTIYVKGEWGLDPLENQKAVCFLRNTGIDLPRKLYNYTAAFSVTASKMSVKWCFTSGSMVARYVYSYRLSWEYWYRAIIPLDQS